MLNATAILAEAFTADEEFFGFIRSMEAYRNSMTAANTTMMIEPDSDFFNYLRSPTAVRTVVSPEFDPGIEAEPVPEATSAGLDD